MDQSKIFKIDLDEIVRSKAGDKARRVPRFVISWLKRKIHQDEINEFLEREGDKQGVPWLNDCVEFLDMKLDVQGMENLPAPTTAASTPSSATIPSADRTAWHWAPSSVATTTAG